jgi:hypothetical protein
MRTNFYYSKMPIFLYFCILSIKDQENRTAISRGMINIGTIDQSFFYEISYFKDKVNFTNLPFR